MGDTREVRYTETLVRVIGMNASVLRVVSVAQIVLGLLLGFCWVYCDLYPITVAFLFGALVFSSHNLKWWLRGKQVEFEQELAERTK